MEAQILKVVWEGYHQDFEVISPPVCANGVLVVHVTNASVEALLKANGPDVSCAYCSGSGLGRGNYCPECGRKLR